MKKSRSGVVPYFYFTKGDFTGDDGSLRQLGRCLQSGGAVGGISIGRRGRSFSEFIMSEGNESSGFVLLRSFIAGAMGDEDPGCFWSISRCSVGSAAFMGKDHREGGVGSSNGVEGGRGASGFTTNAVVGEVRVF